MPLLEYYKGSRKHICSYVSEPLNEESYKQENKKCYGQLIIAKFLCTYNCQAVMMEASIVCFLSSRKYSSHVTEKSYVPTSKIPESATMLTTWLVFKQSRRYSIGLALLDVWLGIFFFVPALEIVGTKLVVGICFFALCSYILIHLTIKYNYNLLFT